MQTLVQLLPQSRGINPLFIMFNRLLQSYPANYISAIAFGIAIGLIGTAGLQKWVINPQAINTCNKPGISDTHRLITLTSVVGDTRYCMHSRYLSN